MARSMTRHPSVVGALSPIASVGGGVTVVRGVPTTPATLPAGLGLGLGDAADACGDGLGLGEAGACGDGLGLGLGLTGGLGLGLGLGLGDGLGLGVGLLASQQNVTWLVPVGLLLVLVPLVASA